MVKAALLAVCVGAVSTPAFAADNGDIVVKEKRTYSAGEIKAAKKDEADPAAREKSRAYAAQQARQGRLVDEKRVNVAVLGADNEVIWEDGSEVTELRLGHIESKKLKPEYADDKTGQIIEMAFLSQEDPTTEQAAPASGGTGMGGNIGSSGGTILTNTCQAWIYASNRIDGCYEKWKPSNDYSSTYDYYLYNRWMQAVGEDINNAPDNLPVVMNLQSRPHVNYKNRFPYPMTDWFPRTADQHCAEGSSVTLGVASLSLTIPLSNCEEKTPIAYTNENRMFHRFDQGSVFGGSRVRHIDMEQEMKTNQGWLTPLFGDYNSTKFCQYTLNDCTATTGTNGW